MPAYRLIQAPTVEPVLLQDLKGWIKQDDDTDDALIEGLITSARQMCETETNRKFITQKWSMTMDAFPMWADRHSAAATRTITSGGWFLLGVRWGFILPFSPVVSVDSVSYNDLNGNAQTLVVNKSYTVDTLSSPARIFPVFSQFWPLTQYAPNGVTVNFTCGYGGPKDVPSTACTAIKMLTSWMYNNRDSHTITTGVIRENPVIAKLLWPIRDERY